MLERADDPEIARAHRLAAAVLAAAVAGALAHRAGLALPRPPAAMTLIAALADAASAAREIGADPRRAAAERRATAAEARAAAAEARAREAEAARADLEAAAGLDPLPSPRLRPARLLGVAPRGPGRVILIEAPGEIRSGAAVFAAVPRPGLAGRVIEAGGRTGAGGRTATVLPVDDPEMRLAVAVGDLEAAVYEGAGAGAGRLLYVPRDAAIAPGDEVRTSRESSLVPAGLPVGEVTEVDRSGTPESPFADVRVRVHARPGAARYVLVEAEP